MFGQRAGRRQPQRGGRGKATPYLALYACLAVAYVLVLTKPSFRRALFGLLPWGPSTGCHDGGGAGAGGGHGGHGVGQHVKLGVDLTRTPFWDKHFRDDKHAELENFANGLFLEYIGDRSLNLTRARARRLSPFFDGDNDGAVTRGEFEQFVEKFTPGPAKPAVGNVRTNTPAKNRVLLRAALVEAVAQIQRRTGGGDGGGGGGGGGGGCGVSLEARKKEWVEVLASGDLQFGGSQEFTIELWVRPEATPADVEQRGAVLLSKYNRSGRPPPTPTLLTATQHAALSLQPINASQIHFSKTLSRRSQAEVKRGPVCGPATRGKWGQYFVRLQPDEGGG